MRYAVLVLEQPWWELNKDPEQTSVRHFLDGLSRLNGIPIFYATFYDTSSFDHALKYLMDARKLDEVDHLILYVAGHGAGARIGNGQSRSTNLTTIFDRVQQYGKDKVAGLILDSCELGAQTEIIERGVKTAKLTWAIGYGISIDWLTSMLINLHLLSIMTRFSPPELRKKKIFENCIQDACGMFNPFLVLDGDIGEDEEPFFLSEVLTVIGNSSAREPSLLRADQIWPELAEK